jgi:ribosomal protein S8
MVEMGALDGARRMALSARTELERNIESAIRAEAEEAIKAAEAFIKTLPALGLKSGKSTHEALQRKVQAARESIESLRSASQQALTPEALAELYPHELRTFPVLRALAEQSHEAHPAETLLEAHELEQITEFRSQRHARLRLEFLSRMPGVLRTLVEEMEALELAPEQNNALDHEYSQASLAEFLGPQAILSASRIERNGITLEAMGQMFPNQPITLPREEYLDLEGLDEEGVVTQANRASRRLWLGLKYHESMPVLTKAQLVSKPTKRVWLSSQDLSRVIRGNQAGEVKGMRQIGEVLAVSTDRGMMEARDCVDRQIGGQVLVRVW